MPKKSSKRSKKKKSIKRFSSEDLKKVENILLEAHIKEQEILIHNSFSKVAKEMGMDFSPETQYELSKILCDAFRYDPSVFNTNDYEEIARQAFSLARNIRFNKKVDDIINDDN